MEPKKIKYCSKGATTNNSQKKAKLKSQLIVPSECSLMLPLQHEEKLLSGVQWSSVLGLYCSTFFINDCRWYKVRIGG